MNSNNKLGTGSVGKLMLSLAVPAVISQVVNMLYNIVDRMYIGHIAENGVEALTGLGLCFPIIMIVSAFSSLFGMGGAPNAAIKMGEGDYKGAEKILGNCTTCLFTVAILLMVSLLIWGENLLYIFGASENTVTYAVEYLDIYAIGTIFVQIALGLNMFITTQGFAKYSMLTVIIGAGTNIILDPIFIFGFDMGVQGAAIATTLSQAISAFWVIKFLTGNKTRLKIRKENLYLKKQVIIPIVALGLAPFIMQGTESILNICFNVSLQKYGGDLAVGTMTILSSIMSLCFMPLQGLTQGAQPIISYNYGAQKMDRVKKAIRLQIIVCVSFTFICWLLITLIPQVFISIFNDDDKLLNMAIWAVRIYLSCLFTLGLQVSCQQTFVALGYAKISLFLACLRKIILLIPLIFILPQFFDDKVYAVFLAEPVADVLSVTITFITFIFIMKSTFRKNRIAIEK